MRRILLLGLALVGCAVSCPSVSFALCGHCRLEAAWGLAAEPDQLFDAAQLVRVKGQILSVEDVAPAKGVVAGTYVLVKTPDENLSVRFGPTSYLQRQNFQMEPYREVEILGSKVTTSGGKTAIVATKAKLGDKTIALRTSSGTPLWNRSDR